MGHVVRANLFNKLRFLQAESEYLFDLMMRGEAGHAAHVAEEISRRFARLSNRLALRPEDAPTAPLSSPSVTHETLIFTDGSNRQGIVSGAMVVVSLPTATQIYSAQIVPENQPAIHDCEFVAVKLALDYISSADPINPSIVTDSTEVLFALRADKSDASALRKTLREMYKAKPFSIRMVEHAERTWTAKAHRACRTAVVRAVRQAATALFPKAAVPIQAHERNRG